MSFFVFLQTWSRRSSSCFTEETRKLLKCPTCWRWLSQFDRRSPLKYTLSVLDKYTVINTSEYCKQQCCPESAVAEFNQNLIHCFLPFFSLCFKFSNFLKFFWWGFELFLNTVCYNTTEDMPLEIWRQKTTQMNIFQLFCNKLLIK